jgi:type II secretory pathway pseudopilin PulG
MEMLAVMSIVCLLVLLVLGLTRHARRAACEAKTRSELEQIRNALQEQKLKIGRYPDTFDWTCSAITNWLPEGFSFRDPWGNPYRYTLRSADSYELYSCGYDGKATNADDIVSGR